MTFTKRKKYIGMGIILLAAIATISIVSFLFGRTQGGLTFKKNSDGRTYTLSNADTRLSGSLTIPTKFKGKTVTAIGESAFAGCADITEVILPSTITSVGKGAFNNCKELQRAEFRGDIVTVDIGAFSLCLNLSEIVFPKTITYIAEGAFYGCGFDELTLPQGVTRIDDTAFAYCNQLKKISIPVSVTYIDVGAFYKTINLKTIAYSGTMEQFAKLQGKNSVLSGQNIYVECSDGTVYLGNG